MTTSHARNPTPRPALRPRAGPEDGVEAARPTTQDPSSTGAGPAMPGPKAMGRRSGPKSAKSKKNKKSKKDARARKGDREVELTITLSKGGRKALSQAAAERETSPEQLASLVLMAWLD